ncbi:zinc finger BED domain-containing protein 4-like [Venturia canescens]|uniref:zinc finger BED domain-containing protein 4-like n=1 Tax=Venturia canescens TaxID=32260 RepID=UPI001C9C2B40|nr:zinc finger BED domain-containing protein 4-like [Venturia canescens]
MHNTCTGNHQILDENSNDDEAGSTSANSRTAESTSDNDEVHSLEDSNEEPEQSESLKSLPKQLRCASHTLNLVSAVDILKIIKSSDYLSAKHFAAMEKCMNLWNALRSPKSREIFHEHVGAALPRPVVTRWNSLYDALGRIVVLKEQIVQVSPQLRVTNALNENDFRYIERYLKILKPIAETLDLLQGEKFCHYGYLLPSLVSLERKLKMLQSSEANTRFSSLITGLIKSLNDRFKPFFDLDDTVAGAAVAACSHPRFKLRWLVSLPESIYQKVEGIFLQAATEEYKKRRQVTAEENVTAQPVDDFFDFGEDPQVFIPHESPTVSVEIARYMASPSTNLEMLEEHPLIKRLFIKFNTPLPSSAPVERLFSYATMMNLPKWNRLTDEHFEQRVLLKANAAKVSNTNKLDKTRTNLSKKIDKLD